MKKSGFLILILTSILALDHPIQSQHNSQSQKLVVGIMIDQMRYDYLQRFYDQFGENGFKRLMTKGYTLRNAHFNYVPTYTGPGHASVYSGTTPSVHGIVGNSWYDRATLSTINCVGDTAAFTVGTITPKASASPRNMRVTTIADALKLSNNFRSKVYSVSIKDRGAILPGGHTADGSFWFDASSGNFISSTYYFHRLPEWAEKFNKKKLADRYLSSSWNPLLPANKYSASGPDSTIYEGNVPGKNSPNFPYDLATLRAQHGYALLTLTPFANSYVREMAEAIIMGAGLGKDEFTDLLAISFSATDAVGHAFGTYAIELQDTYLRLDKDIETLLQVLDKQVGQNEYLVFLSSDHGVVEVPQFLMDHKLPGGYLDGQKLQIGLQNFLMETLGNGLWIENISNNQVYLNERLLREKGLDLSKTSKQVADYLMTLEGIETTYTAEQLKAGDYNEGGPKGQLIRGYHPKRSGNVAYVLSSGWLPGHGPSGTSHGSGYNYDTHVPIIFYGKGVRSGNTVRSYEVTDIAPTLALLLNIGFPSASSGKPIAELFE